MCPVQSATAFSLNLVTVEFYVRRSLVYIETSSSAHGSSLYGKFEPATVKI
jgi:hypothetical protein